MVQDRGAAPCSLQPGFDQAGGWIGPLFIPLVLAGPPITGALAARRGLPAQWPMLLWLSAGINMLWTDWLINHEDVRFHALVAVVTAALAGAGWAIVHLASRRRTLNPHG